MAPWRKFGTILRPSQIRRNARRGGRVLAIKLCGEHFHDRAAWRDRARARIGA